MSKKVFTIAIVCALILGAGIYYMVYPKFFSPIYTWEPNIPVDGQLFVTSKLITNDGLIYLEKKVDPSDYKFGRQIGRTTDGMQIFEIKGAPDHNEIMLTGFMFPSMIFKKE